MSFRVGILGIQHESNTFLDGLTALEDFRRDIYAEGASLTELMRPAFHEVGGFIAELERAGVEIVPIMFARAVPSGIIEESAADQLVVRAIDLLRSAGALDGLLVAPHGAAVNQNVPDFDGHWLAAIRAIVGPELPIVCTIDPHANLTAKMIGACNAMVAYRTNPHIDQRDRGIEAAELLFRHLRGEVRLIQAAAMPPLVINIERQRTGVEPLASLYQQAAAVRRRAGVLSVSIVLGFPYADVAEMGSAFIVVGDGQACPVQRLADEMGEFAVSRRRDYVGQLIDIDAAIAQAAAIDGMSVLLDMGDNVGGGAPGDATALIAALQRSGHGPAVATLFDVHAAQQAASVGVGREMDFVLGAADPHTGKPLAVRATIAGLYDGKFNESQPRHGGATRFDMGPTAVLKTPMLTLIVTSRRLFPVSLEQYRACGLDITHYRYVVVKGVHAPIAAYEALHPRFIHVNTPGVTSADLSQFRFRNRRRPLFPFEEIA